MTYTVSTTTAVVISIIALWDLAWKSVALWRAAQNDHVWWFGFLLVINSAGVLPIIYLMTHHESAHRYHAAIPHGT